jgi:hypothetical protein
MTITEKPRQPIPSQRHHNILNQRCRQHPRWRMECQSTISVSLIPWWGRLTG